MFNDKLIKSDGCFVDYFATHKILRALVVRPDYTDSHKTLLAVDLIGSLQTPNSNWGIRLPFYQTLNALAHLDLRSANRQLERVFEWLCQHQNSNGTWSRWESKWNTFLAVHVLRNKNMI